MFWLNEVIMRNIFFVDSENVGDSWIQLFDYLNNDDCILVFYTDKSPNMSYANVVALKQSPFEPEFILCENGTDNALDFQLVTYLGSYTVKNPDDNLIIVSKDKGFDSVVHFWTERGYHVCRKAPSIFHTLANELSVQKPMLPAIPAFTAVPESIDDSVIKAENPKPDVIVEATPAANPVKIAVPAKIDKQAAIPEAVSTPLYDKEQVDTLLSCVGKSNLSAIHNILISIYGQEKGSYIYGIVKSSSYEIPKVNWQKKTKYRKFLSIVYSNAGISLTDDFYKKLYPHKANLREIHNLFVTKYGQEKGTEYYRYYKSHAEFLQKTF